VLFVDAAAKRVGLSLRPHLLALAPRPLPRAGVAYDAAIIRRVDPSIGVLLELPAASASSEAPPSLGWGPVAVANHVIGCRLP
jgi:rRNA biogenesis protein RRP5